MTKPIVVKRRARPVKEAMRRMKEGLVGVEAVCSGDWC
jgi:hypothetical protein